MIEAIKIFLLGVGLQDGLRGIIIVVILGLLISIFLVGVIGLTLIFLLKLIFDKPSESSA